MNCHPFPALRINRRASLSEYRETIRRRTGGKAMKTAENRFNPLELMKSSGRYVCRSVPEDRVRCIVVDKRTGEVHEKYIPTGTGIPFPCKTVADA